MLIAKGARLYAHAHRLLLTDPVAKGWLVMAAVFRVLSLDNGHPSAPGAIRDYLPAFRL
jgi:hypothetical protein